ncbi:MAG: radical SAM family heme chaperone HemW [Nitrospirae bacterium]|nr:radical SAM family heme chaperone HemW [Nitrospirota bacterium]
MSPSLYVHIPFCLKRCAYCDFVSSIYNPEKETAYIEALKNEIQSLKISSPLISLYIGGGTPTALSTDSLSDLIAHIFKNIQFVKDAEATIEANPGTLDKKKLEIVRHAGINRVSLGVQSFNDNELASLGRLHTSKEAKDAVYLIKGAGFENFGIDLIYGVPSQDSRSWEETLNTAVSLKPKHISSYELTLEDDTLLYEYVKNGKMKLPSEEEIINMYNYAIDYLKAEGFIHYEISNFAMPGYSCRHNLNYWDRGEYYGAGVGAVSFIKGKRFRNTPDIKDYINTVRNGDSPVVEAEDITEDKALVEAIFLGLRKAEGINLEYFSKTYKKDILGLYSKEINELLNEGLIVIEGNKLKLTRKGLLLSNEVFTMFM